jgi:hypothetical protein
MSDWISVQERLPEDDSDVLYVTNEPLVNLGYVHRHTGEWIGYFHHGVDLEEGVTHWMPLPKSPNASPDSRREKP